MYQIRAKVVNARMWGVTFKVPDNPVASLVFEDVKGRFTYNDGTVRELTGGRGSLSVRQWHAYPSILPRELYSDEQSEGIGEKFQTL